MAMNQALKKVLNSCGTYKPYGLAFTFIQHLFIKYHSIPGTVLGIEKAG